MNRLGKIVRAVIEVATTPESYLKGDEFVNYVRSRVFPKEQYRLLQKTHDYASNKGDYIESTKEPDLKLQSLNTGDVFFVEAKYRSSFHNDTIEWCKDYQFKRYREINMRTPIYLTIGVGGQPNDPAEVYIVPVSHIRYRSLYRSFLRRYKLNGDNRIMGR